VTSTKIEPSASPGLRPSLLLFAVLTWLAPCQAAEQARYAAIISVDGLGAEVLDRRHPCNSALREIRRLAESGIRSAGVRGVFPTVTYPTHATIVTGRVPASHGVVDNGGPGKQFGWYMDRTDIRGQTLWDAARESGMSVAVVTWPSTYGAQVNYLIPENLSSEKNVAQLIREGSTPALFDSLQAATGSVALLPFSAHESGTPLDAMTSRFAGEVVRRHRPGLLLIHFLDFDHRQHYAGPGSKEACEALARIDSYVADLVAAYRSAGIAERTTFFIVSDHGFLPVRAEVNVAAILSGAGWADADAGGRAPHDVFDIRLAGGSVVFYHKAAGDGPLAPAFVARLRSRVTAKFAHVVRWVGPAKLQALGASSQAAFALCAVPGNSLVYVPSRKDALANTNPSIRGAHGYCPDEKNMDAVFIASGAPVKARGRIPPIDMVDVGPTIADFIGVSMIGATGHSKAQLLRGALPAQRRAQ
jgi:predicted AlkP superfamily pyrophosphatase or phosphodiesterase